MFRKYLLFILAAAVCSVALLPAPGLAQTLTKEEILAQVQERYTQSGGLIADYQRISTTPSMEGVFQSTSQQMAAGVLQYLKPDKLSLDQKDPRPEKLVTNGQTVWWYIPDEKQVHLYKNVDVYGELKPLLDFLGGMSGLEKDYYVKVVPAGANNQNQHRLDLTRITEGGGPQDITVWLDPKDYAIVAFKLVSLTGESTIFNLANVNMKPDLKEAQFDFAIPEGAKVIEEAGEM